MAGLFDDLKVSGATNETDSGEAGLFGDLKPRKEQNSSTLGDLGTDLKRGVQKLPSVATGLVDVAAGALTNRRFADDAADKAGELTGFQPSKWADEAREEYSPERQAAEAEINDAWKDGTATDVAGAYITNPAVIAGRVAESWERPVPDHFPIALWARRMAQALHRTNTHRTRSIRCTSG